MKGKVRGITIMGQNMSVLINNYVRVLINNYVQPCVLEPTFLLLKFLGECFSV